MHSYNEKMLGKPEKEQKRKMGGNATLKHFKIRAPVCQDVMEFGAVCFGLVQFLSVKMDCIVF